MSKEIEALAEALAEQEGLGEKFRLGKYGEKYMHFTNRFLKRANNLANRLGDKGFIIVATEGS